MNEQEAKPLNGRTAGEVAGVYAEWLRDTVQTAVRSAMDKSGMTFRIVVLAGGRVSVTAEKVVDPIN